MLAAFVGPKMVFDSVHQETGRDLVRSCGIKFVDPMTGVCSGNESLEMRGRVLVCSPGIRSVVSGG